MLLRIPKHDFFLKYITLVFIGFSILVALGITTSSVGMLKTYPESNSGVIAGNPLPIRSDEFLRSTPPLLGSIENEQSGTRFDFRVNEQQTESESKFEDQISKLLAFDQLVIRYLSSKIPVDSGFALWWWYYPFLLFVFMPLLLKQFGVNNYISVFFTFLVFLSPTVQWWSYWPLESISLATAGTFLVIKTLQIGQLTATKSTFNEKLQLFSTAYLSIVFLSQVPQKYQPWSIPVGLIFLSIGISYLIKNKNYKKINFRFAFFYLSFFVLVLIYQFFQLRLSMQVILDTVYPGSRRELSSEINLPIFSTNAISKLDSANSQIIMSNSSELSVAFLELLLLSLLLLPLLIIFKSTRSEIYHLIPIWLVSIVLLLWVIAPWPELLLKNNPLTFIPKFRMAQILGPLGIVVWALFLSSFLKLQDIKLKRIANVYLFLCSLFLLTLISDSNAKFREFFAPDAISERFLLVTSLIFVLTIFSVFIGSPGSILMFVIINVILIGSLKINPIQYGTGDLIHSEFSQSVSKLDSGVQDTWASNSIWIDSVLLANTSEVLSGQQGSGPNKDYWKVIDPLENQKEKWNRGASYVTFGWSEGDSISIENPSPDVIAININPCSGQLEKLSLDWVVSTTPLNFSCLDLAEAHPWMGTESYIYKLHD